MWRGTGLEELPAGQERIAWAKMAAVLVAARFCEPSSELHIAEDWYRRTALCDLLQLGDEEVNKDRLYRGLDHLLAHKAALEAHLSKRCGELFARQNGVLLYDITSTYFAAPCRARAATRRLSQPEPRAEALQCALTQEILHNPLGDLFIDVVATFGNSKGYARHFEGDADHARAPSLATVRAIFRQSWARSR